MSHEGRSANTSFCAVVSVGGWGVRPDGRAGGAISDELAPNLGSSPLFDDEVERSWRIPRCLLQA